MYLHSTLQYLICCQLLSVEKLVLLAALHLFFHLRLTTLYCNQKLHAKPLYSLLCSSYL